MIVPSLYDLIDFVVVVVVGEGVFLFVCLLFVTRLYYIAGELTTSVEEVASF